MTQGHQGDFISHETLPKEITKLVCMDFIIYAHELNAWSRAGAEVENSSLGLAGEH